jgi:hypothetical protein
MSTTQTSSNIPVGIHKISGPGSRAYDDAMTGIVSDILKTREVRQLLITVVPEFLNVWAGRSWWKKTFSKTAGFVVNNQLSQPEDVLGKDEITALFENEKFIKNVAEQLPGVINGVFDALAAGTGSIERMSVEDKQQLFAEILSQTGQGRTGAVLTRCARTLVDIHSVDPEFFTKAIEPGFIKWVESVDLGEFKEMLDNAEVDGRALVEMVMTVLFEYPTKFVVLLALLPGLVNFIMDSLKIILGKVNTFPPDMLTDVVLALAKDINGASIANLLNQLTEVVRKIHTGSELLGEPGSPQLPKDLSGMMGEIISQIDPVILWKSKIALAEIKASTVQTMTEAVNDNPAYKQLDMVNGPEITNIRMKSLNQKLTSWESFDDEETSEFWGQHLAAYNVQETAEVANNVLRLINRLATEKPAIFDEFIGQFASAIDDYELTESVKNVFNGASEEIRPAARAVVPGLVTWICDVIKPEDDEYEDDAAKAREAIQSLFAAEEV